MNFLNFQAEFEDKGSGKVKQMDAGCRWYLERGKGQFLNGLC